MTAHYNSDRHPAGVRARLRRGALQGAAMFKTLMSSGAAMFKTLMSSGAAMCTTLMSSYVYDLMSSYVYDLMSSYACNPHE